MNLKVLVTGGNGYIGKHVCHQLAMAGHDVTAVDDCTNSDLDQGHVWFKALRYKQRNMYPNANTRFVVMPFECLAHSHLEQIAPDVVIHLAGLKSVRDSQKNPDLYWQQNVINTIRLARICAGARVRLFEYSSSAAVYGPCREDGSRETDTPNPSSVYGQTKFASEQYLAAYAQNTRMEVRAMRYFNVVGGTQYAGGDEGVDSAATLFGACKESLRDPEKILKVRGSRFKTRDGTAVRDFIHVEDLADAHVHIMTSWLLSSEPQPYRVLNVGTGVGVTVEEVCREFKKHGVLNGRYVESDASELPVSFAAIDCISRMGWKASHTLESMVRSHLECGK